MRTKENFVPDASLDVLECLLTPQELAFLAGTTPGMIEQLADLDLIVPSGQSTTLLFQAETVQTVRKILRMQRHLQISFDSMSLIFDLLDRIDALEKKCRMQNSE